MKMDDLQLNITVSNKDVKKTVKRTDKNVDFKFVSKPKFVGKTIARKRPNQQIEKQNIETPKEKVPRTEPSEDVIAANLRNLSENKGKFQGKNYQDLNDDLKVKKARSGGWISSLFKNNPEVPRIGQRAVKPLVEKVFAGKNFSDLEIHPHSVANLQQNLNLKELMVVQQKAIPVILNGRDVLIRSQTGSGKTLSYALPLVEGLQAIRPKINRNDGIRAVVVVPTRELAVQTYELLVKLVKPFTWVVPGLLSGGQKRKAEKARLRKGLSILVGTPGRINDHLRHTQSLNFAKTGCLILDEADRLLDMGYEKDVAAIVKAIEDHKKSATYDPLALVRQTVNKKAFNEEDNPITEEKADKIENKHPLTDIFLSDRRQTILLSATLTKAVENLAGLTMIDPVFVDTSEGRAVVADSLNAQVTKKSNVKSEKVAAKNDDQTMLDINPDKMTKKISNERRGGLKEFNGGMFPDLFTNGDVKVNDKKAEVTEEESDSDSDYEYFKSQNNKMEIEETAEEGAEANKFAKAVQSAIIDDELMLPATVNQTFLIVPMKLRLVTLCALIVEHCVLNKKGGKMIVFMATLEMVDYHSDLIETVLTGKEVGGKRKRKGGKDNDKDDDAEESDSEFHIEYEAPLESGLVPVDIEMFKLHGSMPHEQRMEVFKQFRAAKAGVLICTDVAARGLDVPHVDLVLQYCAPASATDYVHRVGRTGRATRVGAAKMLLLPSETEFVRYLEKKRIRLRQAEENRCLENLRSVAPTAASSQRAAITVQARLEHVAHSHRGWIDRASRAYMSWVRFYSGYPRDVKEYLDSKSLHLGHAAKAFALRDTPAMLAKRAKQQPLVKEKPSNRLTVLEELEKKRPGFPRAKNTKMGMASSLSKQSSMHTASEFASGFSNLDTSKKKKRIK